jgi:hypothetical protein
VWSKPQLRVAAAADQLICVRGRDDPVRAALHDQDRRLDPVELKAPRLDESDVVVDQPVGPGVARMACALASDAQVPASAS